MFKKIHMAGISMRRVFYVVIAGGAVVFCLGFSACSDGGGAGVAKVEVTRKSHHVRGIVRGIGQTGGEVSVEHEEIPGFMPAMTMPFLARDPGEIAGIKVGDAIAFELIVTADDSWIQGVRPIDAASLSQRPAPTPAVSTARRLKEGDTMPAFHLVDQKNRPITSETFSGKMLLLTFIFTRCPIPNYCPLMSQSFEQIDGAIRRDPDLEGRVRLLSISFDPEFDTPEVLARYGGKFSKDGDFWRFATGTPGEIQELTRAFSVYVESGAALPGHGLCTALLDSNGTIKKIWRGNGWHPEEVLSEMRTTQGTDVSVSPGARTTARNTADSNSIIPEAGSAGNKPKTQP